ncbi:MAG: WD40 repeat domain-containing protein [Bacteroidia bacterium]|jgi:WD40 repeat protein|nr:WD40 repeat domain-containing protein [Bacteroidia bacterium]
MGKIQVTKTAHYSGHKGSIFSLTKGRFPHTFFSGADDGLVVEWNAEKQGDGVVLVQVNRPVYSMLLINNSTQLICGTASGNLHLIDLVTKKEIRNIEAHTLGVFDICLLNQSLVTGGGDGWICEWDLSLNLIRKHKCSDKSVRSIAYNPLLKQMAAGSSDHCIRLFDAGTLALKGEWKAHTNSVFTVVYHPTLPLLYSGGRDALLKNWDVHDPQKPELDIPAHTLHINQIAFSPNQNWYVTVSMDKTIKLWDATTNELLKVVDKARNDGHMTSVNKVLWLSATEFVTCSDDKTVMAWEVSEAD